jgi:protein gp37
MRLAGTRLVHHESRAGLTRGTKAGPVWTGEVRFNEQWLDQPLRWKKPRLIFVCAHGDLFAENVPDEWIDKVFAVMALAPHHTFQVLTKRAKRMREYLSSPVLVDSIANAAHEIDGGIGVPIMPLPNALLGVSVEDQKRADERIPDLLATPAAVRWISAEPLLGPVDLRKWLGSEPIIPGLSTYVDQDGYHRQDIGGGLLDGLDWVVAGGESGKGARVWPGFEDACRSLRDQCRSAGVPFFMKQMQGARKATMPPIPDDLLVREIPR